MAQPTALHKVNEAQKKDTKLEGMGPRVMAGGTVEDWSIHSNGGIYFFNKLCLLKEAQEKVMKEAHQSRFTIHPGQTKMYHDLRHQCWWQGMKRDIAQFVFK